MKMSSAPDKVSLPWNPSKNIFLVFLLFWLVLNMLQAYFTGLFNDEAYYFFYSRDLAWGYYDHPPLLALLIKIGYFIFSNELGVRIIPVILSLGTMVILYMIAGESKPWLFITLFFSFLVFQISGFLAIPDSLLLFFTALFFLVYKKYTEKNSLGNAVLLGLVMTGMFYSKYLGVLIVIFTVLSNIRLLWSRTFWLAVIITSVLYLPHLLWQYQHDFPSVYYHLLERSHDEIFRWSNFGDYIAGQAALVNPILFIPVIYFLFRFKPRNSYEKSLMFNALGSLFLPLLFMLKGRVEANWTMAGLIPVFLISYHLFTENPKFHRFIYITSIVTLVLILPVRLLLTGKGFPTLGLETRGLETLGWKDFSHNVSKIAGDRPAVFIGSYQKPSQYMFYSGKDAFSFNNALYRNNQFDLANIEQRLIGKEVLIFYPGNMISKEDLTRYDITFSDSIAYPNGSHHYYQIVKNYYSYNFLPIEILPDALELNAGSEINIPVRLINPAYDPVFFGGEDGGQVYMAYMLLQLGKPLIYREFEDISSLTLDKDYHTSFTLEAPEEPGTYYIRVSLKSRWLPAGINSRIRKVKVH